MTASAELTRRQRALSETLNRALHALRRNVVGTQVVAGSRQLDHVRQLKQSVRELLVQSQALEEALRGVLDEDEDMEAMYLTRRHLAVLEPLVEREHEEVELLLESYLQEVGATVSELDVLTYAIEGTEKFVSFRLDSARNRLLKFDVIATASATALGVGQLISGLFGMNLPTSLFDPEVAGDDAAPLECPPGFSRVVSVEECSSEAVREAMARYRPTSLLSTAMSTPHLGGFAPRYGAMQPP